MKKAWVLSYPLSAQADLSLRWAHTHFVCFDMLWLISIVSFIMVFVAVFIGILRHNYLTSFEQVGAKMENPQEKQPAHPQADFGMSELGSNSQ